MTYFHDVPISHAYADFLILLHIDRTHSSQPKQMHSTAAEITELGPELPPQLKSL
jgi:hypothetical protein